MHRDHVVAVRRLGIEAEEGAFTAGRPTPAAMGADPEPLDSGVLAHVRRPGARGVPGLAASGPDDFG